MSASISLFDDPSCCPEGAFLPALHRRLDAPDPLLDALLAEELPPRRRNERASPCRGPGLPRSQAGARTSAAARRSALARLLPAALLALCCPGLVACGEEEPAPVLADTVLVQLHAGQIPSWREADDGSGPPIVALEAIGPEEEPPLLRVPVPAGRGPHELCRQLEADLAVDLCEPVTLLQPSRLPNDPRLKELWGLAQVDAPAVWEKTVGDRQVTVAVVDDGVALDHPDLRPNLWVNPEEIAGNGRDDDGDGYVDDIHGYDFIDRQPDGAAVATGDAPWHGSHVAGTIGAAGDNRAGVAGVNWRVSLMALRALGPQGGRSDDLARAIDYAAAHGARVINASWGGGGGSQVLTRAIARAGRKGSLFVAAAGNSAADRPEYPANLALDTLLSVGATGPGDVLAPFSDRGALVAAPGVGILSTTAPGQYERQDGTSMAAPHVSGLAALLWSAVPDATLAEVRDAILASGVPVAGVRHGRIDAGRALAALEASHLGSGGGGALVLSRGALSFTAAGGSVPRAQTVPVREQDGAARKVAISSSAGWLLPGAAEKTTPFRLSLRADPSGLKAGTHHGTVTLTAGGATTTLAVSLQVGGALAGEAGPQASGPGCAVTSGTLHVAAGSLCALVAPGFSSDAVDPGVRWTLPGGAVALGSTLHARFPRRGAFTLLVDDGAGPREVPVSIE